jgi:hypothetical protein
MRPSAIARRAAVAIAGIAGILVFAAGTAQAAPVSSTNAGHAVFPAVTVQFDGPSDSDDGGMTTQASYTFSHSRSQLLYNAGATAGVAAVVALCSRWAPAPACVAAGGFLMALIINGLASNECYQLYTKWTPPFWGARIVRC